MEKIPTAESLLRNKYKLTGNRGTLRIDQINMFMIEFAKLHVEAALKAASESESDGTFGRMIYPNSILTCYSLENIK
jgi:hypothetical protein